MTAPAFPAFPSHADVACFNCDRPLKGETPEQSGYPPRRGAWQQPCSVCNAFTFYDLKEGECPKK